MKIHSRERGRHRSAALRVLALLLVFNFHFLGAMFGGDAGAVPLVFRMLGSLGTCMFLVLVGVVAQAQLNNFSGQARPYWIKRFWRLYPPYFGVVALYLIGGLLIEGQGIPSLLTWSGAFNVLTDLLLMTDIYGGETIVTATWALQYVALYSLAAPAVWRLAKSQTSPKWRCGVLFALFLGVLGGFGMLDFKLPVALPFAGALLLEVFEARVSKWALAAGIAASVAVVGFSTTSAAIWMIPGAVLIAWTVLHPARPAILNPSGFVGSRIAWIGERSFEFYLSQGFVTVPLRLAIQSFGRQAWWINCLLFVLCFQANIGLAHAAHWFLSRGSTAEFERLRVIFARFGRPAPAPIPVPLAEPAPALAQTLGQTGRVAA